MPETIKASEQNLNKVFCDDYVFEIPHYQASVCLDQKAEWRLE